MGAGGVLLNTVTTATPNSHLICCFLRKSENTGRIEHRRQRNRKGGGSGKVGGNQAQTAAHRLASSLPLTKNAKAGGDTETIFEKKNLWCCISEKNSTWLFLMDSLYAEYHV